MSDLKPMPNSFPEEGIIDVQTIRKLVHDFNEAMRVLGFGKVMRDKQKLFYQLRKKVGKAEHDALLHDSIQAEKKFDRALDDLLFSKVIKPDQQPSLL